MTWVFIVAIYFIIQILLPLRHWLYPGNVNWTEEGHRLSWHMMLRVKSGYVFFKVKDKESGQQWEVSPHKYLTYKQSSAIASRPDMCWQFVQILKDDFAERGYDDIEIYALGKVSLNGRPQQALYDESVDLAQVEWKRFSHSDWLLPLKD